MPDTALRNTMSIAAIVLTQPSENQVAGLTLRHLRRGLGDTTTVITLVNGGGAADLRRTVGGDKRFQFIESPVNLGVAGGRKRLLEHAAAKAADVIVILDNDIIPPPGICDLLAERLAEFPGAGVISGAIFDWTVIRHRFILGQERPIENDVLALCHSLGTATRYFHLGTVPDWRGAYFDELMIADELAGLPADRRFKAMNSELAHIVDRLTDGDRRPIEASNLAGACQAFRRSLIDEIGSIDPIFSPYGYEDVDFCLRALDAGYSNLVMPDICLAHGTDQRHQERRRPAARLMVHRNLLRCKVLLASRHLRHDPVAVAQASLTRRFVRHVHHGEERAGLFLEAGQLGILDGKRQLQMQALAEAT